jgi:hypothetical protein
MYPAKGNLLNQSLVESHLEGIPSLGTLTTGGLSGGDLEGLGWQTHRTLDTEILALGTLNEFLADLLKGSDLSASQGNSDLVLFLRREMSVYARTKSKSAEHPECKHTGPSPNSFSGFW